MKLSLYMTLAQYVILATLGACTPKESSKQRNFDEVAPDYKTGEVTVSKLLFVEVGGTDSNKKCWYRATGKKTIGKAKIEQSAIVIAERPIIMDEVVSLHEKSISNASWEATTSASINETKKDSLAKIGFIALSPLLDPLFVALVPFSFGTSLYGLTLKYQAVGDLYNNSQEKKPAKKFEIGRVGEAWEQGKAGELMSQTEAFKLRQLILSASELPTTDALDCPKELGNALAAKVSEQVEVQEL